MKKIMIMLAMALAVTSAVATDAVECDGLYVATGPARKGYSSTFADIQAVCGAQVKMCEVNTDGGLTNISLAAEKGADVIFAPVDALNTMKTDENVANLLQVASLNNNYLHPIAAASGFNVSSNKMFAGVKIGTNTQTIQIQKFSDLRNMTVAAVGTAKLTVRQMSKQLGLNLNVIDVGTDAEGKKMVQSGQAAAYFTLAGWSNSNPVAQLTQNDNLTLVPVDLPINQPYNVKGLTYRGIAVYNVNTVGVMNVLMARNFKGEKAQQIVTLKTCMSNNLQKLQEGRYSPAWNEIKTLDAETGWAKIISKKTK